MVALMLHVSSWTLNEAGGQPHSHSCFVRAHGTDGRTRAPQPPRELTGRTDGPTDERTDGRRPPRGPHGPRGALNNYILFFEPGFDIPTSLLTQPTLTPKDLSRTI